TRKGNAGGPLDFIQFFTREKRALERRFAALARALAPAGMLWISWPKKASGVATDLTEDVIRVIGLAHGLVDVKVAAVDDVWSGDASVAIFVDVQNTLVNTLLRKWASDDVKRRYLPRLASDLLGAYALSEPESGSDAFGLQTRATRRGSDWILEGRKLWITNGAEAGLFIVFANSDFTKGYKGITAFAVERGFRGFGVGKKEDKLGIRASSTCE